MIPTDTPHGTRVADRPEVVRERALPAARSSASRTAISSAALAIGWPLNGGRAGRHAVRGHVAGRKQRGTRNRRSTSRSASMYSEE